LVAIAVDAERRRSFRPFPYTRREQGCASKSRTSIPASSAFRTPRRGFDPYAVLKTLDRNRVTYIVIGAFARVIQGIEELTRGVDIVPSTRPENLTAWRRDRDNAGDAAVAAGLPFALASRLCSTTQLSLSG
jgi:hypothetical protein